jgi:hypothetical protein
MFHFDAQMPQEDSHTQVWKHEIAYTNMILWQFLWGWILES